MKLKLIRVIPGRICFPEIPVITKKVKLSLVYIIVLAFIYSCDHERTSTQVNELMDSLYVRHKFSQAPTVTPI